MTNPAEESAPDEALNDGFQEPVFAEGETEAPEDPDFQEIPEEEVTTEKEVTELTSEQRLMFQHLLTVGKITRDVDVMGFKVRISTLSSDDEIRVFREAAQDENTAAYPRAYQTAIVAASVSMADGNNWNIFLQADPSPSEVFASKLSKARDLHPLVIQYIYEQLLKLNSEFAELARTLGKLNG